jgi:hypothetical protein
MTTISTTITGAVTLADKSISLNQRIAVYEHREIELTATGGDVPAGNYRLMLTYGGRAVATSALSVSSGKLTGTLNLSTTQLEAVFAVLPVNRVAATLMIYDVAGKTLWATGRQDVWRNEYDEADPTPVPVRCHVMQGVVDLDAGATSATISFAGLGVLATASIAATLLIPDGGDTGLAVIGAKMGTDEAVIELSGAVPGEGYKLSWMVAQ